MHNMNVMNLLRVWVSDFFFFFTYFLYMWAAGISGGVDVDGDEMDR